MVGDGGGFFGCCGRGDWQWFFFGWVFLVESIYIILMTSKNKYQDVECIIKWYDTIDNVTF